MISPKRRERKKVPHGRENRWVTRGLQNLRGIIPTTTRVYEKKKKRIKKETEVAERKEESVLDRTVGKT